MDKVAFLISLDPGLLDFATPRKNEELVPWSYYSRAPFTAAAMATSTPFFNSVPADSRTGNMELASQIPSPKRFLVTSLRVHIASIVAAAVSGTTVPGTISNDVNQIVSDCQVEFSLGDKVYVKLPVWKVPSGGGLVGFASNNATGGVTSYVTNGLPDQENGYEGAWPIPSNTSFSVLLKAPAPPTLANAVQVTIMLDGWLIRPHQ